MTTSITTFQKAKTGSLAFPFVSKFGIIEDAALAAYLDAMDAAGHDWQSGQFSAFAAYVAAGKADGWWDRLMCVMPFWGDNKACLGIPLLTKTDLAVKTGLIATSNDAPGTVTDWNLVGSEEGGGRHIGAKFDGTHAIAIPFAWDEAVSKGETTAGQNVWGALWTNNPAAVGAFRAWGNSGIADIGGNARADAQHTNPDSVPTMLAILLRSNGPTITHDGHYLFAAHRAIGEGVTSEEAISGSGGGGRVELTRSGTFASYASVVGTALTSGIVTAADGYTFSAIAGERVTVLGRQLFTSGTREPGAVEGNTNTAMRWFSFDDGSLGHAEGLTVPNNGLEPLHRAALGALFDALGKDYE